MIWTTITTVVIASEIASERGFRYGRLGAWSCTSG